MKSSLAKVSPAAQLYKQTNDRPDSEKLRQDDDQRRQRAEEKRRQPASFVRTNQAASQSMLKSVMGV